MSSLQQEHLDIFVRHTVATLPDSLRLRKTILVTTLSLLPKTYPRRFELKSMLENIHAHDRAQLKFQELLVEGGGR